VHAIFNEVEGAINDLLVSGLAGLISRYDDPLAVGTRPVVKTIKLVSWLVYAQLNLVDSHILRSSSDFLVLCGLCATSPVAERSNEAKTGALVPLGGPLFLLLSAMV
jgi:hypothetical protein